MTERNFSDVMLSSNVTPNSSQTFTLAGGHPLDMSYKNFLLCASRMYVCSDSENINIHTDREKTNKFYIFHNENPLEEYNKEGNDNDKLTKIPDASEIQRTDSWRTITIHTCSREMINRKNALYKANNSEGASKARYMKEKLQPHEPDTKSIDLIHKNRSKMDNCLDDNSFSTVKLLHRIPKTLQIIHSNEGDKLLKYRKKKFKLRNCGANTENQINRCSEKWTYCRPRISLYNPEDKLKYINKVRRIKKIVKQIASAREKEKQQEAWKNPIDQLQKNTLPNIDNMTDSATEICNDQELKEYYYKTDFESSQSARCTALLADILGHKSMSNIHFYNVKDVGNKTCGLINESKPEIKLIQNNGACYSGKLCTESKHILQPQIICKNEGINTDNLSEYCQQKTRNKLLLKDAACYPMNLIGTPCTESSSRFISSKVGPSKCANFAPFNRQIKLVSNKSVSFPTSSSTLLHSANFTNKIENTKKHSSAQAELSICNNFVHKLSQEKHSREVNVSRNISNYVRSCYDDLDKTNMFIRNYIHDFQPEPKEIIHLTSHKMLQEDKNPCCNSTNKTKLIVAKNYNESLQHATTQSKKILTILKNRPFYESVNTRKEVLNYENGDNKYVVDESTISAPSNKETIYFSTVSNLSHSSNASEDSNHNHVQRIINKIPKRKATKIKTLTRKVQKPVTVSGTTQTEQVKSYGSKRRYVIIRYKDYPDNPISNYTKTEVHNISKGKQKSSEYKAIFKSSNENSIEKENEPESTYDSDSKDIMNLTIVSEYINDIYNPTDSTFSNNQITTKKNGTNSKNATSESECNKYLNEIAKRKPQDKNLNDKEKKSKQGNEKFADTQHEVHELGITNKMPELLPIDQPGIEQREPSKQYKHLFCQQKNQMPNEKQNFNTEPSINNKSKQVTYDTEQNKTYKDMSVNITEITRPRTSPSNSGKLLPSHDEFQRISDDVARLKIRNEKSKSNTRMKCLEDKLDKLIDVFNNLVVQHKDNKTPNQEETKLEPTYCSYKKGPPVSTYIYTTDEHRVNYCHHKKISPESDHAIKINSRHYKKSLPTLYDTNTSNFRIITSKAKENLKIEKILQEEIGKSDQAKKDIEDIINGDFQSQTLEIRDDIPTRECSTEVTASLSKTKIKLSEAQTLDENIMCNKLCAQGKLRCNHINHKRNLDHQDILDESGTARRYLTITLDTIPLGILELLRVSSNTIGRLLSFMHGSLPCGSLLPVSQLSQLETPAQFVCNLCKAAFGKNSEFTEHMQSEHRVPSVRDCCVCRHLLLKKAAGCVGVFTCRHCGQTFTRAYCRELHQQNCARKLGKRTSVTESLVILK